MQEVPPEPARESPTPEPARAPDGIVRANVAMLLAASGLILALGVLIFSGTRLTFGFAPAATLTLLPTPGFTALPLVTFPAGLIPTPRPTPTATHSHGVSPTNTQAPTPPPTPTFTPTDTPTPTPTLGTR